MRTMYDSVNAEAIPLNAVAVAGYVDGSPEVCWKPDDWLRFPNARRLGIATQPGHARGTIIDVERFDVTPEQAPAEVLRRRAAGIVWPWVYCSFSVWPAVAAEFEIAKVAPPLWWVAAYPGIGADLYTGSIAHQFHDAGGYDVSVIADGIPGFDTTAGSIPSAPAIPNVTGREEPMTISQKRVTVRLAYLAALGREPESQQAEDTWAAQIADDGSNVDLVIASITDGAEAKAYRTAVRKVAGLPA